MFGKHRLQKPTRFVGLPTKWKVSPKTDEIMGNSGTATAVPAVPRAAPLLVVNFCRTHLQNSEFVIMLNVGCEFKTKLILSFTSQVISILLYLKDFIRF